MENPLKPVGKLKQSIRKKLWQEKFNQEVETLFVKYKKEFETAVLEGKMRTKDVLNLLKIMVAPMRFGKTRLAITHHIPFLIQNTDVNCIILTSPLGAILRQKERTLRKVISKLDGVEFCDDPYEAQEALDDGSKVILIMTNMGAWVGTKSQQLFDNIEKSKVAFIIDEAHTWTTDHPDNVPNVISGGGGGKKGSSTFKAALYERVRKFSPYTPFIFGLTATTNNQHKGYVPALGNMKFKVINSDFIDDGKVVKILAYRLGWFDPTRVRYMDFGLYENVEKSFLDEMVPTLMWREETIGQKLTCFIEAKRTEKYADENASLEEIKSLINKCKFKADDVDENSPLYVIMKADGIQLYTKNGTALEKVTEKEVYSYLNDQEHPLRFLVVVDMAKMGVDLQSTKLLFSFRTTEKKAKLFKMFGFIIEAALQKFGRLMTPNAGVSEKDFFEKFDGDFRNVPNFHPEMNMMDYWIMVNGMNNKAMGVFGEMFAPEMPDMESHLEDCDCPTCGQPWPEEGYQVQEITSDDIQCIDEALTKPSIFSKIKTFFGI